MNRVFQASYTAFSFENEHIFRDKYGGLFHCLTREPGDDQFKISIQEP